MTDFTTTNASSPATVPEAYSDRISAARNNFARILVEISTSPKPSYTVNGQTFSWTEYQRFLMDSIKALDTLIDSSTDSVDVVSQGFT
jgi:hypothetical protein